MHNVKTKVMIIAHRGASGVAPENTLVSVRKAWELGADAVEIDVHLTLDKKVVVIHDDSAKRTAGIDMIVNQSGAAELCKLDVGSYKSEVFAGETIPLLEEVLQLVPVGKKLVLEIKSSKETAKYVKEIVEKAGKSDQVIIISFDSETIEYSKEIMSDVPAYWLVCSEFDEKKDKWQGFSKEIVQKAKDIGADGLDLSWVGLDAKFVRKAKSADLGLIVWTVDDKEALVEMLGFDIDGITTNWPGQIRRELPMIAKQYKT